MWEHPCQTAVACFPRGTGGCAATPATRSGSANHGGLQRLPSRVSEFVEGDAASVGQGGGFSVTVNLNATPAPLCLIPDEVKKDETLGLYRLMSPDTHTQTLRHTHTHSRDWYSAQSTQPGSN